MSDEDHLHLHVGSKPAPGDLAIVQGFVNTADLESGRDDLATVEWATDWLRRHGLLAGNSRLTDEERRRLVDYREALRGVLELNHGGGEASAARKLTELASDATLVLSASGNGTLQLTPQAQGASGVIARLSALIYESWVEGSWQRLKVCTNDECRWAFFDASRNRSGQWCRMDVCGNRMKVRHHRERQRR